jgi:hypothetical protein
MFVRVKHHEHIPDLPPSASEVLAEITSELPCINDTYYTAAVPKMV